MINFKNYPSMTRVHIPNSVNLVNNSLYNAFNGLANIQTISMLPANVTNMGNAYRNCYNLTTAVCGPNVTNMSSTYYGCTNLTTAVCGNNVTSMYGAYYNCTNLTTAVCGPNVTNMSNAYYNCTNVHHAYFYSNNVSSVRNCFKGKDNSIILNIYVHDGSKTMNRCLYTNGLSIIGHRTASRTTITWTDDLATNGCYFNTAYNIYIYPVADVVAARTENGD